MIGTLAMSVFTIIDDQTQMNIPHFNLMTFITILTIGVILHCVRQCCSRGGHHEVEYKPLMSAGISAINGDDDLPISYS